MRTTAATKPSGPQGSPAQERVERLSDRPLNYFSDQLPDIEPALRRLNLKWAARQALLRVPVAALVAGLFRNLLKRRIFRATCWGAGLLAQLALTRWARRSRNAQLPRDRHRDETALERYALKAQRGDYGKLEVIAFK